MITTNPTPASPMSIFDLLKSGKTIFTLHYMAKHKPHSGQVVARDFNEAKHIGSEYCKKYQLLYLSVTPFFLDPNATPLVRKMAGDEPEDEITLPKIDA